MSWVIVYPLLRLEFCELPNTACTRSPAKNAGAMVVGVCAFSSSLFGARLVPSKWRYLVPPRRIEPVEITSGYRLLAVSRVWKKESCPDVKYPYEPFCSCGYFRSQAMLRHTHQPSCTLGFQYTCLFIETKTNCASQVQPSAPILLFSKRSFWQPCRAQTVSGPSAYPVSSKHVWRIACA